MRELPGRKPAENASIGGKIKPALLFSPARCSNPHSIDKSPCPITSTTQSTNQSTSPKKQRRLNHILQVGYPTLCKWNEKTCEAAFAMAGCVPRLRYRKCWKCGGVLTLSRGYGEHALRCYSKGPPRCNVVINDAKIAYTPLQATKSAGHEASWKNLARCLYSLSLKTPINAGVHYAELKETTVQTMNQSLRVAFAYTELMYGREMDFPEEGTLEYDGTRTSMLKDGETNVHVGRMLVACHRESGLRCFTP